MVYARSEHNRTESVMDPTADLIARTYAQALLETETDDAAAEKTASQLENLVRSLDDTEEFQSLLSSAILNRDRQEGLIQRIFHNRVNKSVEALLVALARRGRLMLLGAVCTWHRKLLIARQGRLEVTVTTATKLSKKQFDSVADTLKASLESPVELHAEVDCDILGGVVVRIGDRVYNASLADQLQNMRKRIAETLGLEMSKAS